MIVANMPTYVIMTIVWRADLDSKPKAGFHIKSISILSKFDLYVCGEGGGGDREHQL